MLNYKAAKLLGFCLSTKYST